LKKNSTAPSKYSSLVLAKNKDSSFERLSLEGTQNDGYSFTLSAKHGASKSYVGSYSSPSGSLVEIKSQKDSNYALQTFSGTDGKIVIETNNDLKIIIDSSGVIQILAGSSVVGIFSKSENTITLTANETNVTIESSGVSINRDTTVSGTVTGNKFVGQLSCVGSVIQGNPGSINVTCS
jgi:RNase P/RNase MRP subunit p29